MYLYKIIEYLGRISKRSYLPKRIVVIIYIHKIKINKFYINVKLAFGLFFTTNIWTLSVYV